MKIISAVAFALFVSLTTLSLTSFKQSNMTQDDKPVNGEGSGKIKINLHGLFAYR